MFINHNNTILNLGNILFFYKNIEDIGPIKNYAITIQKTSIENSQYCGWEFGNASDRDIFFAEMINGIDPASGNIDNATDYFPVEFIGDAQISPDVSEIQFNPYYLTDV